MIWGLFEKKLIKLWIYLGNIGFWSVNQWWSSVPESDFHDLLNQLINQENAYKVLSIMS